MELIPFQPLDGPDTWYGIRSTQQDWDILKAHCNMFHNALPCFDVPSYSIHVDHGAHVSFRDAAIACQLLTSNPMLSTHAPIIMTNGHGISCAPPQVIFFYNIINQMFLFEI
jgi:hypothetical protein